VETREMRDHDKIWTDRSMDISTVDQMKFINSRSAFWHSLWSPLVVTRREGVSSNKILFGVLGITNWRFKMPHLQIHEMRNRESALCISAWS
jgi:hypothetical protein